VRRAAALALALALGCGGAPAPRERLDEASLWGEAAPLERALTFARRRASPELLLVSSVREGRVEAVAFPEAADPIALLERLDAAAVRRAAAERPRVSVLLAELGLPAELAAVHVAAGANFAAHGAEVGVEAPFLFPKLVAPTPFASDVPHAARLDYEVELCFVALRPLASAADVPGGFGVLLCNDFTDRWTLARALAFSRAPMGTRGFADAKGRPGFLPVGAFLVVPDDLDAFLAEVVLELYVNGELRQRSPASAMIWKLPELVERSFAARETAYHHAGGTRPLLPAPDGIPARTLVLSGTPAGVVFSPSNVLFRGGLYLAPGDVIVARASGLGALQSRVAPPPEDS
jgi:2-keto-4-pentenoate hydratase/2-oxohepta-3-ene-1,7-dioic acid hydratase in catechol pathway